MNNIRECSWECHGCKTIQLKPIDSNKAPFFQVDAIEGNNMLMSNFHEQRFVKYQGDPPPINVPYCRICVDKMPGSTSYFSPESSYTFEQTGKTCWNLDKVKSFTRDCGSCVSCGTTIILKNLFGCDHTKPYFFLVWSPHLASRSFPDPLNPQVWTSDSLSKLYKDDIKPSTICADCFKVESSWKASDGPVQCPLCNQKYQRWIFRWATGPANTGCGCYCHVYPELVDGKEIIMDGYIDPEEYEWVSTDRPDNFDSTKPFCDKCLTKLVAKGLLKSLIEYDSTDDD